MTTPGEPTVYRFVSDGRMAVDVNRDAMARMNRPFVWLAASVASFTVGFGLSYQANRDSLPYYRGEVIRIATGWGLVFVALTAGAVLLGLALGRRSNRWRMRRLYPEGSATEVELTADALILRRPSGTRSIPYGDIRKVKSRERVQWLVVRRRPLTEALPASLLPPDALDAIRARSRGAVPFSSSPPPTGPARQLVVPEHWASHVAAATVRRTLGRPRFWVRLGLAILVSIPMGLLGGRAWLALAPALALVSLAVVHLQTRRSIASTLPPGSLAATEVHQDRLVSRSAHWTRVIPFDAIRRIDVRGDVVFIEMTTVPPLLVLARELVPDDLIERHSVSRSSAG